MTNKNLIKANLVNVRNDKEKASVDFISQDLIRDVNKFHRSISEYSVTPLHNLKELSNHLGVKNILVKDESHRFGLNAFKVLGGAYAIGKYLGDKLDMDISDLTFEYLSSDEVKEKIGQITFITATDGNHGRGVAWAAQQLGQRSVVYMPRGSSESRLRNISKEGAQASIIDGNYEDAVELSEEHARENGWVVIQDTAWEGYEDIPRWIMQGYGTIIYETLEQMKEYKLERPTHIFLQAGVGSFAAAILGYLVDVFGKDWPITLIMESHDANCLYLSSLSGKREIVEGDMPTIMAGLACGAPNTLSFPILKDYADGYISCHDDVAARGMRILAKPLRKDPKIRSGESGAVGAGLISILMEDDNYKDIKEDLKLDKDSVILLISTEGDTDPDKYQEIVWG